MEIRKAQLRELDEIMEIYDGARTYMREHGNAEQWGDGYPSRALIGEDIETGRCHVCVEDGALAGVFCYFEGEDPTYQRIYDGAWLNDKPYGVIHRIAVAQHRKGVASYCFAYCFALCKNLKIDTHRDNIPMQRSLAKNGFTLCGTIFLESGAPRMAYQRSE
jgi:RimJ/RimL family protein N-acetyltransferase